MFSTTHECIIYFTSTLISLQAPPPHTRTHPSCLLLSPHKALLNHANRLEPKPVCSLNAAFNRIFALFINTNNNPHQHVSPTHRGTHVTSTVTHVLCFSFTSNSSLSQKLEPPLKYFLQKPTRLRTNISPLLILLPTSQVQPPAPHITTASFFEKFANKLF